jgi:hypothetical protein
LFIIYNENTIEIEAEDDTKIEEFKKILEEKINVKKENQIIMKKVNNEFFYEKTIKENNINEEETLIVINTKVNENFEEKNYFCGTNFFIIF